MLQKSSIKKIIENIPQFFLGILMYVAFSFFCKGIYYFAESQNSGGKGLGAFGEGMIGFFYLSVSLLFLILIFIYLFKHLIKNQDESKLYFIILGSGILFGFGFKYFRDGYDNYVQAKNHISNFRLAQNYVNENFRDYEPIYNNINDSIDVWKKDSLWFVYEESRSLLNTRIDSLIIFNKQKNRFKACSHFSYKHDEWKYNTGFKYIYGLKYKDKWIIVLDPHKQDYLVYNLFNLESSKYPSSTLGAMYRIYKIKGEIYPDQIDIPMVNDRIYFDNFRFDSLQVLDQMNIIDTLLDDYKKLDEDYLYYDDSERYERDWKMRKELKKAIQINKLILKKIKK